MRTIILLAVLVFLAAAYLTKPSEADFREALRDSGDAMEIETFGDAVDRSAVALGLVSYNCEDYVFMRLCEANLPNGELRYAGAFRGYIAI